jgi:FkbH-like protein
MSLLERRLRYRALERALAQDDGATGDSPPLRVGVLASFSAAWLVPYLGTALVDRGLTPRIHLGGYQQIAQECLSDDSGMARFRPNVLVVWARLEELWSGKPWPLHDDRHAYAEDALALADIALDAARAWDATLVWVLPALPELRPLGVGDAGSTSGVVAAASAAREALRDHLADHRGVLLFDVEEVVRHLGAERAYDPRFLAAAHQPFTQELLARAADGMARLVELSRRAARKLIVVDGDNTLWGGVLGEDGPEHVDLDERGPGGGHLELQRFLLELRRAGWLLALCSKNLEEDVVRVFERREMVLRREHLATWRIGWQPKSRALQEIALELNVGVDSVVFVDDSPAELAEVAAALGDVVCLRMSADPVEWDQAFRHSRATDRLRPTREDLLRADAHVAERRRDELALSAASPRDYLESLEVELEVTGPNDLARLAQLVTKTNQFNLDCRRRSEAELKSLVEREGVVTRLFALRDRFGDYGIVGATIAELCAEGALLDTFVLSCRALGRGIEDAMLAQLAVDCGSRPVAVSVREAPRNEPARAFFARAVGANVGETVTFLGYAWPEHVRRRTAWTDGTSRESSR